MRVQKQVKLTHLETATVIRAQLKCAHIAIKCSFLKESHRSLPIIRQ
jgi:hypothetical protein